MYYFIYYLFCLVTCQGSSVSIKSRHPSTDKGRPMPFSPLNRWTKAIRYTELDLISYNS